MNMLRLLIDIIWIAALLCFGQWAAIKLVTHYQSLDWLYIVGVTVGVMGVDSLRAISLAVTRIFKHKRKRG